MEDEKYKPPDRDSDVFTCPHCGVFASQNGYSTDEFLGRGGYYSKHLIATRICLSCNEFSLWIDNAMIYPDLGNAPLPNSDMPEDVKKYYNEAKAICNKSPRAAAGLLRLAIHELVVSLKGRFKCKGKNLNDDIATLVSQGLPESIKNSLDYVRVIGNNAVHPGQIEGVDNEDFVNKLFSLVNTVCYFTVSRLKQEEEAKKLRNSLPESVIKAMNKRDKKAKNDKKDIE